MAATFIDRLKISRADILLDLVQKGEYPRGQKLQIYSTKLTYSTAVIRWNGFSVRVADLFLLKVLSCIVPKLTKPVLAVLALSEWCVSQF